MKKRYHQTGIRIEEELYQELRQRAHKEWRTVSSEINYCIKDGLKKTSIEAIEEQLKIVILTQEKILSILESQQGLKKAN